MPSSKPQNRKYNIPLFIPHEGCGHDCVFCNQRKITGHQTPVTPEQARDEIIKYLSTITNPDGEIEIAFFGGSFTGLDIDLQRRFFEVAASFKDERIRGIRLSTRPDYINKRVLDQCVEFGVRTIELGVQSASDKVLEMNRRGHTFAQVEKAAGMIKDAGIDLGLQMMVGMYGSDKYTDIQTCEKIIALKPVCTRIYPTLVLKNTYLEELYMAGEYRPYDFEQAIDVSAACLKRFRENGIKVIRIGLHAGEDLRSDGNVVAGAFHVALGEMVENRIYRDKIEAEILKQGLRDCDYVIEAAHRDASKIIGHKSCNRNYFNEKYGVRLCLKKI